MNKKYGIFIMRAQPFHLGHQAVINEILLDGLTPIIVLGSSDNDRDVNKNPLTFDERKQLIQSIYPTTKLVFVKSYDFKNWTDWYYNTEMNILYALRQEHSITYNSYDLVKYSVIYYNNKEIDKSSFIFKDKEYINTWYTKIYEDDGFELKESSFNQHPDLQINANAKNIRRDLEANKHLLDARVYHQLKQWGWK